MPNIGNGVLDILESPQPPPTKSILTTLLNEIASIPDDFLFVLDDYHAVDSKPVDEALSFLLKNLPPQMHLVITTREDPDLPLSKLRARGQLTELRASDLRFTPAEAAQFLNQVMGLNLSEVDITALETRTEGWIAGLQLAALSMQGHSNATSFIQTFTGSNHFVLDYLVEEVLHQQTEVVQTFLLCTSLLDRLSGPLCDTVLDSPFANGQETLEFLEHNNLFITPLDNERRWYRYHHLFAELLHQVLRQNHPEQILALHQRASEWYTQNDLPADAIHHSLAAEDFERAAYLIELAIPDMRRKRQTAALLSWLKALPKDLVYFRPVLSATYAWVLFGVGELQGIEARLQNAEHWLETTNDSQKKSGSPATGMVVVDEAEFHRLPSMIAIVRAGLALANSDMSNVKQNAQKAYDLAIKGDHLTLGGAASQLGLAAWANGDLATARLMTAEGLEKLHQGGYLSAAMGTAITLADIQISQGCLNEAKATYERALNWVTAPNAPYQWGAADMHVGMSALYYEHNNLESATQHLLTSQSLGELAALPQNPYRWCAAKARIQQAHGNLDEALNLLEQAENQYDGNLSPNVRPIATRKVRVWIAQGRLDEALGWVRDQGLSFENELSYLHEFDHITLTRVLLAIYQNNHLDRSIQEAMGLLERLLKAAEARGGNGSVIEILMLQAIAYHAQGDLSSAVLRLQRAFVLAEPEGYVRMFLDEGTNMIRLLLEASSHEIIPDYTNKLLADFNPMQKHISDNPSLPEIQNQHRSDSAAQLASSPVQPLFELLSQREKDILRMLQTELTGPEIARELVIALSTVRTHTKRIYSKLNVNNRRAAVKRATEMNLI